MIGGAPWWGWLIALSLAAPFVIGSCQLGLRLWRYDRRRRPNAQA